MAGILERVNNRVAIRRSGGVSQRDTVLTPDEWAGLFEYGGLSYPIVQTTMGNVKEERIAWSSVAANQGNSAVFSLVQARIQAFAQIRFQWTRFQGAQPGDLWGTPELQVLEQPWPHGRTANLLAIMEMDNQIAGNSYICRPRRDRLARLRPDLVTIVLGSQDSPDDPADADDVEIAGYIYWRRTGGPKYFGPDEVAHYASMPDPNFQFLGMSWLTPCIREVQGDSLMTEHKTRFLINAATPNLAIKFDPAVSIDMVMKFKKLMEEEHQGVFNAYKTLYLGGGADVTPVGANFKELDFSATQGKGEARLASAAGVPASWVGFSEGLQGSALNASTFQNQRRRFSDGTLWHLWSTAASALQTVVQPPDSGASLWFDARVPFMREDAQDIAEIQSQNATTIGRYVQEGFTPESAIAAVADNDVTLLQHTGMVSVQLQPPGGAVGTGDMSEPDQATPVIPGKPAPAPAPDKPASTDGNFGQ